MAHTALKTEDEKKEYFDTKEELEKKVEQLAEFIKSSKHFVAFTGAGISTSTGIPDFRSGYDTVLATGPGCWEKAALVKPDAKRVIVPFLSAVPSYTHMAFVTLMEAGYLKFVVSQNVDGLHRKSGIPSSKLAELHGNVNLERCGTCKKEYMRDFETGCTSDHKTGRKCTVPGCGGDLYDSIINFGESLPKRDVREGFDNCLKADVCLAMGSSLRVTPAADMPAQTAEKGGKLVIVNLQKTPLEKSAASSIHGMCDEVIKMLMKKLGLEVKPFRLKRRVKIQIIEKFEQKALLVEGIDHDGTSYTLLSEVEIKIGAQLGKFKAEPFMLFLCSAKGKPWYETEKNKELTEAKITLQFHGHYGEPNATIAVSLQDLAKEKVYMLEYNPAKEDRTKWDSIIPA